MNRVLAYCTTTDRVLLTGPDVAPSSLRWVGAMRYLKLPSFRDAPRFDTEALAYQSIVSDHLASSSDYDD